MRLQHRRVTTARVEPHVEGVRALAEHRPAALATPCARRKQLLLAAEVPLLDPAAATEDLCNMLDNRLLEQHRLAAGAVEGGDRHAPHALAGERPVRSVRDHVEDALLAPGGDPAHVASDGLQCARAEAVLVEGHEPLLGGAEQRRVLAAPAVRVRVLERHLGHERADRPKVRDDLRIRLPHCQAGEVLDLRDEPPVVVDGVVDTQPQRAAEVVVFLAVARRDVHEAGAGVHGDERRGGDLAGAGDPRVAVLETGQRAAGHRRQPARLA